METNQNFEKFLDKIKVDKGTNIDSRYNEITKKLNQTFRNTSSEEDNRLRVGSYGRYTGVKGISDLDMLYIMPKSKWEIYKDTPQKLLADVRNALKERYPKTDVHVDRLVVDVCFEDFTFEVQPVFELEDDDWTNYQYPDTKDDRYKITKPKQEQKAMTDFKNQHGEHHRHLCKMMRAWKNHMGVGMGGLLIDTLTYKFLSARTDLDFSSFGTYDVMVKEFFAFLKDQPKQDHYQALGSNQDVKVKHPFKTKAMKAYRMAKDAIENERNEKWREIFGRDFPKSEVLIDRKLFAEGCADHEEFIEDKYPVDIQEELVIDCMIERAGFRTKRLREVLSNNEYIPKEYSLTFQIKDITVKTPYEVRWKVRNVGEEAIKRNCLRGEILCSNYGPYQRREHSNFYGPHYVECYIIKNGVVVARDKILVPIEH